MRSIRHLAMRGAALAAMLAAAATPAQAALNGSLYAVIAPTYNGAGGTTSFIRLFNGGAAATNFSVTVQGSPSGNTYGTATISIPVRASQQFSLGDILSRANAGALAGGDTNYSLYIQNPEPSAGYQHVTFNGGNNFFENVSSCKHLLNQSIGAVVASAALINVHTTRLTAFPSQVEIHNFFNGPVTYRLTVIAARTGTIRGTMDVAIAANETRVLTMSSIENQVNWQPATDEQHANIVVTDPSGAAPNVMLSQSIVNQGLSANISMSTACAVNAPAGSGGGGGLGGGGGISY
ncbi:MAG: hypothetical protein SFV21_00920 [Rhodospirillaceae bacterium]|nr:hypothetical protein [Rhodospirillaceae bacterium]